MPPLYPFELRFSFFHEGGNPFGLVFGGEQPHGAPSLDGKGGFALAHWDGTTETEAKVKEETKATIRCIPLDAIDPDGVDPVSGSPSATRVYYARAY